MVTELIGLTIKLRRHFCVGIPAQITVGYKTWSLGYIQYTYANPLITPLVAGLVGGVGGLLLLIGLGFLIKVCVK